MKVDEMDVGTALAIREFAGTMAECRRRGMTGEMIHLASAMQTVGISTATGWDRKRFLAEMEELWNSMRGEVGEDFIAALDRKRDGGLKS